MRFPAALIAVSLVTTALSVVVASTKHDSESTALSVGKEQTILRYPGCSANQSQEIEEAVKYAFDVVKLVIQVRDDIWTDHLDLKLAAEIESSYFGDHLSEENKEYITNVFYTLLRSSIWTDVTYSCVHSCSASDNHGDFGIAYTMPDRVPMIIFICPNFLNAVGLKKIEELPQNATWTLNEWISTGSAILREMLHLAHLLPPHDTTQAIKPIIDEPVWSFVAWGKPAYVVFLSKLLATKDQERALTNAENYALYALELFVSDKAGWAKLDAKEVVRALWSWTGQWFHGEL